MSILPLLTLLVAVNANSVTASAIMEVAAPKMNRNEYYIFTQELNANESKLGVPVAVFTLTF